MNKFRKLLMECTMQHTLSTEHHAKPSGRAWTDPAERAWCHVNRRPRVSTERAAFRYVARLFR